MVPLVLERHFEGVDNTIRVYFQGGDFEGVGQFINVGEIGTLFCIFEPEDMEEKQGFQNYMKVWLPLLKNLAGLCKAVYVGMQLNFNIYQNYGNLGKS